MTLEGRLSATFFVMLDWIQDSFFSAEIVAKSRWKAE
jgi:hypothetical protein